MNEFANELNALNHRHQALRDHHTEILREHGKAIETLRQDLAASNLDLIPTTIRHLENLHTHVERLGDRIRHLTHACNIHQQAPGPTPDQTDRPNVIN